MINKTVAFQTLQQSVPAGKVLMREPGTGTGPVQLVDVSTLATHIAVSGAAASAPASGSLPSIANNDLLANTSGSSAQPTAHTLTAYLDSVFGNTQGSILYRGASVWAELGPGTAGQFLKTQGASANPVWATVSSGTGGGLYGQILSTTPTSAGTGLTNWLNQGPSGGSTGSVADVATGITITAPSAGGDELRVRYKTSPGSTPYSFTALIANTAPSGNYSGVGIGWTDGTKLQVISLGYSSNWLMNVANWTTTSSISGSVGTTVGLDNGQPVWVKIRYDGTTVFFQNSWDGVNFQTLYSETASTGFLSGSLTDVLFYANGNGQNVFGTLLSWTQGT